MTLPFAREPTAQERRRRRVWLGVIRRLAPLMRLAGRWAITGRLDHYGSDAGSLKPGFYLPLDWVEATQGLLIETCPPDGVDTILADWVEVEGRLRNTLDWHLGAGDWRSLTRSTVGDPVREEARQLLVAGFRYRRTPAYEALLAAIGNGMPQRRQGSLISTAAALDGYFERFVRLFRSVERHGMLSSSRLDGAGLRFNGDRGLGIAIDVDGRRHRLQGGNHRWAIAQVLELTEVPVEIRLVHAASLHRPALSEHYHR